MKIIKINRFEDNDLILRTDKLISDLDGGNLPDTLKIKQRVRDKFNFL